MLTKKDKIKLNVEKRKVIGHKVKLLRQEGILPANIYGKEIKSLAVQVDLKSFLPILKGVGETGLVELKVKGEDKVRPVLIHNIQYHSVSDEPLHADFYQVDLKEKVTAKIPVELVGESAAVKGKVGILIQPLSEIEVEALPADLPEKIELNISSLEQIDDAVTLADVKLAEGVRPLTDTSQILAKIEPPAKEEEVAPVEEKEEGEEVTEEGEERIEEEKKEGKEEEKEPQEEKTKESLQEEQKQEKSKGK